MAKNVSSVLHFPKNYINVFLSSCNRNHVTFPNSKEKSLKEIIHICLKKYNFSETRWISSDEKQTYNLTAKGIKYVFEELVK